MKILVLGITGLIGNKFFRSFSNNQAYEVYGTIRNTRDLDHFNPNVHKNIFDNINAESLEDLKITISTLNPEVIINCIGITKNKKQVEERNMFLVNEEFPHQIAKIAKSNSSRLIHISTDCVFSGIKGDYSESDVPDPIDNYGKSKLNGEINYDNHLTIRTSMIGHELKTSYGLLNWFLNQKVKCDGYHNALFSGFPSIILAYIFENLILQNQSLRGIYHVGSKSISKHCLLNLISIVYKKNINIKSNFRVVIDRTLNSSRFIEKTGYRQLEWIDMVNQMYKDYRENDFKK